MRRRCRRRATRPARTTSTCSTSDRTRSSTTRTSASGATATTCRRTSSRPGRRRRPARRRSCSSGARCSRASPHASSGSTSRRRTRRAASTSASFPVTSTARRCRRPASPTSSPRSTTRAASRRTGRPTPASTCASGGSTSTGRTRRARRSATTAQPSFTLPVAPFVRPQCTYGYGDCPLQKGGPQGLDALGDRLMFRLAVPQLRRPRVARAQPHRQGRCARGHPLVRGAEPGDAPVDLPAGNVRARRLRHRPAVALDGQHRHGQAAATSRSASARPVRTTIRPIRYTGRGRRRPARPDDAGRAGALHGHRTADRGRKAAGATTAS